MIELKNGIKIIGCDTGYGNAKGANSVTKAGIYCSDTQPIFSGDTLEYGGEYYTFGEGHKAFIADKTADNDFYMFTLMIIARELNREKIYNADVYIAAGLPLTWIRVQRDSFKEYLMKNKAVEFVYKGNEFHINIIGCSVYPQGYPAIVQRIGDFRGINILADIGNGTMNIMYIRNKKPMESDNWTEKLGVEQCVIKIKNAVMDNYGVKMDESIIEAFLRYGSVDVAEKYLECMRNIARQYVRDIFSALESYNYDENLMRLWIIGGGSAVVKNFGEYNTDRVTIIEDICANAKGYEYLAYQQLRRLENGN